MIKLKDILSEAKIKVNHSGLKGTDPEPWKKVVPKSDQKKTAMLTADSIMVDAVNHMDEAIEKIVAIVEVQDELMGTSAGTNAWKKLKGQKLQDKFWKAMQAMVHGKIIEAIKGVHYD
jgi:hypothetical protein